MIVATRFAEKGSVMKVPWDSPGVRLQLAAGAWLHAHKEWKWWATLTFARPVGSDGATAAVRRWSQLLAKLVRKHIWVAWAIERAGDGHHVHLLLDLRGVESGARVESQVYLAADVAGRRLDANRALRPCQGGCLVPGEDGQLGYQCGVSEI